MPFDRSFFSGVSSSTPVIVMGYAVTSSMRKLIATLYGTGLLKEFSNLLWLGCFSPLIPMFVTETSGKHLGLASPLIAYLHTDKDIIK